MVELATEEEQATALMDIAHQAMRRIDDLWPGTTERPWPAHVAYSLFGAAHTVAFESVRDKTEELF